MFGFRVPLAMRTPTGMCSCATLPPTNGVARVTCVYACVRSGARARGRGRRAPASHPSASPPLFLPSTALSFSFLSCLSYAVTFLVSLFSRRCKRLLSLRSQLSATATAPAAGTRRPCLWRAAWNDVLWYCVLIHTRGACELFLQHAHTLTLTLHRHLTSQSQQSRT